MHSISGQCRAIQENAGTQSEKQNISRECTETQIHPGEFHENAGTVVAARWSFVNKTASAARDVFDVHAPHRMTCSTPSAYSQVRGEIRARQASRAAYYLLVRGLRHFIGVRVGDEHVARLDALAKASGFTRGEILRRALLNADIPSSRTRQEVQDLLRIQREQNRLGGLLKKALTEREEKAALRRTLIEVERNAAELRRCIAHLVRSR